MTTKIKLILLALLPAIALGGCAVVHQDEIGVKRTAGKLREETLSPGMYAVGPFSRVLKLPNHVINLEIALDLPSKEGLTVASEISILYRIDPDAAHKILSEAGEDYEASLLLSTFRSASADVCARFMAKDMHSGSRADIEAAIQERMTSLLANRGFIVEAVLLKSIKLPPGLSRAIEQRLEAEQDAMRMQFVLQQEQLEAERKMIAAKGTRDAQIVLSEGLTDRILKLRALETFLELAKSPNAKIIITDPTNPMQLEADSTGDVTPLRQNAKTE